MKEETVKTRSVCIAFAQGCTRSQADVAMLFHYFRANNLTIEKKIGSADLVVVFTCGFDSHREEASLSMLKVAHRKRRRDSQLIVLGCLAAMRKSQLEEEFGATSFTLKQFNQLDKLIDAEVPIAQIQDSCRYEPSVEQAKRCFSPWERAGAHRGFSRYLVEKTVGKVKSCLPLLPAPAEEKPRYVLRVASGCLGKCTYCAIRFYAGKLRSRPLEQILDEFDAALAEGHRVFDVVGGDVGPYGQDLGISLVELFGGLFERDADFQLHITDIHPKWFAQYADELIPLFAQNQRKIGQLKIPIQSGSDEVLQRMRRDNTVREAREALLALKRAAPDISLETHVLVGFPGETAEDFEQTVEFLEAVPFDPIHAYKYSDRPMTKASRMPDGVPERVKERRVRRLRQALRGKARFVI